MISISTTVVCMYKISIHWKVFELCMMEKKKERKNEIKKERKKEKRKKESH